MGSLPGNQGNVLRLRFGIVDEAEQRSIQQQHGFLGPEYTLREIGVITTGVTRERIRQQEKEAMGRLRRIMESNPTYYRELM